MEKDIVDIIPIKVGSKWLRLEWEVRVINNQIVSMDMSPPGVKLESVSHICRSQNDTEKLFDDDNILIKDNEVVIDDTFEEVIDLVNDGQLVLWAREYTYYDEEVIEMIENIDWNELPDYWKKYDHRMLIELIWTNYQEQVLETKKALEALNNSRSVLSAPYKIQKRWKNFEWEVIRSDKATAKVRLYFNEIVTNKVSEGDYFVSENDEFFVATQDVEIYHSKLKANRTKDDEMYVEVEVEAFNGGPEMNGEVIDRATRDYGQSRVEGVAQGGTEEKTIRDLKLNNDFDGEYLIDVDYFLYDHPIHGYEEIDLDVIVEDQKVIFLDPKTQQEIDYNKLEKYISSEVLTLWAPRYYIHNDQINKTLAPLIDFDQAVFEVDEKSELYFNMVKGLWFVLATGPTIKNLEIALYILFGLPVTYYPETEIVEISHNRDQIKTSTGEYWHFDESFEPYNFDEDRYLEEGDVIKESYTPLIKGPRIRDYINYPGWWEDHPFLPSSSDIGKYTYTYSRVSDNIFFGSVADVSLVAAFLENIFPSYANYTLRLDVSTDDPAHSGVTDRLGGDLPDPEEIDWPEPREVDDEEREEIEEEVREEKEEEFEEEAKEYVEVSDETNKDDDVEYWSEESKEALDKEVDRKIEDEVEKEVEEIENPPLPSIFEGTGDEDGIGCGGYIIGVDEDGSLLVVSGMGSRDVEVDEEFNTYLRGCESEEKECVDKKFFRYRYKFLDGAPKFDNYPNFKLLRYYRQKSKGMITSHRYEEIKPEFNCLKEELKDAIYVGYIEDEPEKNLEFYEDYLDKKFDFDFEVDILDYYDSLNGDLEKSVFALSYLTKIPATIINGQHGMENLSFDDMDRFGSMDDKLVIKKDGEEIVEQWKIR